jgi:hypothetical protein
MMKKMLLLLLLALMQATTTNNWSFARAQTTTSMEHTFPPQSTLLANDIRSYTLVLTTRNVESVTVLYTVSLPCRAVPCLLACLHACMLLL